MGEKQPMTLLTLLGQINIKLLFDCFFNKSLKTSDVGMPLHLVQSHIVLISTLCSTKNQIKNNLA